MKSISEFIQEQSTESNYNNAIEDVTKEYVECMSAIELAKCYAEHAALMEFAVCNGYNRINIIQEAADENKKGIFKRMGEGIANAWKKIIELFKSIFRRIGKFFKGEKAKVKVDKIEKEIATADINESLTMKEVLGADDINIKNNDVTAIIYIDELNTGATTILDLIKGVADSDGLLSDKDKKDGEEIIKELNEIEHKYEDMKFGEFKNRVDNARENIKNLEIIEKQANVHLDALKRVIEANTKEYKTASDTARTNAVNAEPVTDRFGNKYEGIPTPGATNGVKDADHNYNEYVKRSKEGMDLMQKIVTAFTDKFQKCITMLNASESATTKAAIEGKAKADKPTVPTAESFYFV